MATTVSKHEFSKPLSDVIGITKGSSFMVSVCFGLCDTIVHSFSHGLFVFSSQLSSIFCTFMFSIHFSLSVCVSSSYPFLDLLMCSLTASRSLLSHAHTHTHTHTHTH